MKHANSEVQKPPSQLRFSLSAINHDYDDKQQTLKHRNTQNGSNPPITNHKP